MRLVCESIASVRSKLNLIVVVFSSHHLSHCIAETNRKDFSSLAFSSCLLSSVYFISCFIIICLSKWYILFSFLNWEYSDTSVLLFPGLCRREYYPEVPGNPLQAIEHGLDIQVRGKWSYKCDWPGLSFMDKFIDFIGVTLVNTVT